jgi:uracil phosphoribosyltransferase
MSNHVTVIDHPLVLHKLSLMRDKETPSAVFRKCLNEISLLLAYEVLRDLPLEPARSKHRSPRWMRPSCQARNCASSPSCGQATDCLPA